MNVLTPGGIGQEGTMQPKIAVVTGALKWSSTRPGTS